MHLPNVTLCCIDTEQYALSALAIRKSRRLVDFGRTIVLTDRDAFIEPGWELHRIAAIRSYSDLNNLMFKHLYHHIETDFVLNIQYDGFVVNPHHWSDEYLSYDYIGAPWPDMPPPHNVGNGGFSLRSRKLLKALQDERIQIQADVPWEDQSICRTHRPFLEANYGIRFAPAGIAERFSCESPYHNTPKPPETFGFHGFCWLVQLYSPSELLLLVEKLADYSLKRSTIVGLAATLVINGRNEAAGILFRRIARHLPMGEFLKFCQMSGFPPETVALMDKAWRHHVGLTQSPPP